MKLTEDQINALLAFIDAVENLDGVWPRIAKHMRENWGIDDPDSALEEVTEKLRSAH